MERITSRRMRSSSASASSRATGGRASGEVLLDGAHLVQEALALRTSQSTSRRSADTSPHRRALSPIARSRATDAARRRVLGVTDQVLAAMSPVHHRRAWSRSRDASRAGAGSPRVSSVRGPTCRSSLVLAGVQDPGNVGAIVRTAAACGATGVVAIEGSANPFGWKALRGAMGGTFRAAGRARGTISRT